MSWFIIPGKQSLNLIDEVDFIMKEGTERNLCKVLHYFIILKRKRVLRLRGKWFRLVLLKILKVNEIEDNIREFFGLVWWKIQISPNTPHLLLQLEHWITLTKYWK